VPGKANPAYVDGLKMLARRDLSEARLRERLARRGHQPDLIDDAVSQLREERAIDDARVAEAIARTETSIRRRGKLRVQLQMERGGIDRSTARRVADDVFAGLDEDGGHDSLIEASLARRLPFGEKIEDDRAFQRLYRYLIGQGFEADRVLLLLNRRKRP
jgi:regulatory protein